MRSHQFALDLHRSAEANLLRLRAHLRSINKVYKPTAKGRAILRRNAKRMDTRKAAWKR
jgi:DNA-binding PadR family transcriptional regulator